MANINHIQHLHSQEVTKNGNIKLPSVDKLLDGEIAVNYASQKEVIAIRNSEDEIATFSSDNVIMPQIDELKNLIGYGNSYIGVRGYGEKSPMMQIYQGNKELLNDTLSHFKLGWFDGEGKLVYECAPCRISQSVDGTDIPIDGSLKDASGNSCDLMAYVDTDLYVDRCTIGGLNVKDSTATTHNVIGLGLFLHQIGGKWSKRFEPFGFAPHFARVVEENDKEIAQSFYDGQTSSGYISYLEGLRQTLNKGGGYMGLYYEFYEIWLIAMYLELGTIDISQQNLFGDGWGEYYPTDDDWFNEDNVGGCGLKVLDNTYRPYLFAYTWDSKGFPTLLRGQKLIDDVIKAQLIDSISPTTLFTYDDNGNCIMASSDIDVTNYDSLPNNNETNSDKNLFFTIRNVQGCQGVKNGVMTAVVNVYRKNIYLELIMKESYQIYRGITICGMSLPLVGLYWDVKQDEVHLGEYAPIGEYFYCDNWREVPNDISLWEDSGNTVMVGNTSQVPPILSGMRRGGEEKTQQNYDIDGSNLGWVKEIDYNISLFASKVKDGASQHTYECSRLIDLGRSFGSPISNDYSGLTEVGQSVNYVSTSPTVRYKNMGRLVDRSYHIKGIQAGLVPTFSHPQIKLI